MDDHTVQAHVRPPGSHVDLDVARLNSEVQSPTTQPRCAQRQPPCSRARAVPRAPVPRRPDPRGHRRAGAVRVGSAARQRRRRDAPYELAAGHSRGQSEAGQASTQQLASETAWGPQNSCSCTHSACRSEPRLNACLWTTRHQRNSRSEAPTCRVGHERQAQRSFQPPRRPAVVLVEGPAIVRAAAVGSGPRSRGAAGRAAREAGGQRPALARRARGPRSGGQRQGDWRGEVGSGAARGEAASGAARGTGVRVLSGPRYLAAAERRSHSAVTRCCTEGCLANTALSSS